MTRASTVLTGSHATAENTDRSGHPQVDSPARCPNGNPRAEMILTKARAGPRGRRLPCSQLRTVWTGTPIRLANAVWEARPCDERGGRTRRHRASPRHRPLRSVRRSPLRWWHRPWTSRPAARAAFSDNLFWRQVYFRKSGEVATPYSICFRIRPTSRDALIGAGSF